MSLLARYCRIDHLREVHLASRKQFALKVAERVCRICGHGQAYLKAASGRRLLLADSRCHAWTANPIAHAG